MFKVGDFVLFNDKKCQIVNINVFRDSSKQYALDIEGMSDVIFVSSTQIKPIKNKKPSNYYSKFTVGQQIKTIDDLVHEDSVIFMKNGFRKTYNKGWFMSFQLRMVANWIDEGYFYYAVPKYMNK